MHSNSIDSTGLGKDFYHVDGHKKYHGLVKFVCIMGSTDKKKTIVNLIVYYTGIGANKSGKHTKDQFLRVMKKTFIDNPSFYQMFGAEYDPKKLSKFTFKDWVKWSGAEVKVVERKK